MRKCAIRSPSPGLALGGGSSSGAGRKIVVIFVDGESLAGTTLNYTADGPGFFLVPSDAGSDQERIFDVQSAIRRVPNRAPSWPPSGEERE